MRIDVETLCSIKNIDKYGIVIGSTEHALALIYKTLEDATETTTRQLTDVTLNIIREKGIHDITIQSTSNLLLLLRNRYPDRYPHPTGIASIKELIRTAEDYEKMSGKSKKKRTIRIMEDLYNIGHGYSSAGHRIVVEYNTLITPKTIEVMRRSLPLNEKVDYYDSESGVLVFVPDVKKFKLKVDLFAIITSIDEQLEIMDASSLAEAIQLYEMKSPKLVVIGDMSGNLQSKEFSLRMEAWDPFVKKLNFDESPATNRASETRRIKKMLEGSYKPIIESVYRAKEPLPAAIKEIVNNSLKTLGSRWTHQGYIELAYAIKQFGRMFNISVQWNRLLSLRREHEWHMVKKEEEEN